MTHVTPTEVVIPGRSDTLVSHHQPPPLKGTPMTTTFYGKTFVLPYGGGKIRPQSQRRYVLVHLGSKGPFIGYRTDVLQRAIDHGNSRDIILDQVTGLLRYVAHQGGSAAEWQAGVQ